MTFCRLLLVLAMSALAYSAELDTGGNSFLRGDYFVRQVIFSQVANNITFGQAEAIYGTINFDGNGSYNFRGNRVTSIGGTANQPQPHNVTGLYRVGANGLAEIESLIGSPRRTIFGAVGASAVVGSMTESTPQVFDMFIAVPASANVTNAALQGRYLGGTIDVPRGVAGDIRTATFEFNANGSTGLSGFTARGQARNQGGLVADQTVQGATYNFGTNGEGTFNLPLSGSAANQRLVGGDKVVYTSADGNLIIGGSATGYDMLVAFKAAASASPSLYNGTYLLTNLTTRPMENGAIWASFGSTRALGTGDEIAHERTNELGLIPYDVTSSLVVNFPSNGIAERERTRGLISADGRHLLWVEKAAPNTPRYSFLFMTRAREYTGSGVFVHPLGVTNAASYSPVTASIAPGEFVTLFGTGLAPSSQTVTAFPFPTTLAGVQVRVNGEAIPLYSVSPTQISGVLPYSIRPGDRASFTVVNNGVSSNLVTQYIADAATGVFTIPANGLGVPAALRPDNSIVSRSNPARRGETIAIFATGLGRVDPPVAAGEAAPLDRLSRITAEFINVEIDGRPATVAFAGLAPGYAGLYQINVTVPGDASPGDAELYIDVDGSVTFQTLIPVQ